jgi:hypothetical protein
LDDEAPDSPTVTILEMYPEAAATTSMVGYVSSKMKILLLDSETVGDFTLIAIY